MKVLVAHNRYRSDVPSGENLVVGAEIELLREAGIDAVPYLKDSDTISLRSPVQAVEVAAGAVWAPKGIPHFRETLARLQPDVVHLHNVYPLISPWAVRVAHSFRVPVVQTVHNFRHDCVAGTYFRDGAVCTDCAGRLVATPAVAHGCYRGSRVQSLPMVVGRTVHRRTWRSVDRFLALTSFHAEFLRSLGVADEQVVVRPTSAPDPGEPSPAPGTDVVFVGRLEQQKGIELLLAAWRAGPNPPGRTLHVVGDGPLRGVVEAAAAGDPSIVVHGLLPQAGVADRVREAGVVVIPSTWFEGLPRVLVEAASHGRALAVSDLGGLGASVPDDAGWRFSPDVDGLRQVFDKISPESVRAKGEGARQNYLSMYSPEVTTGQLLDVYRELAGSRR